MTQRVGSVCTKRAGGSRAAVKRATIAPSIVLAVVVTGLETMAGPSERRVEGSSGAARLGPAAGPNGAGLAASTQDLGARLDAWMEPIVADGDFSGAIVVARGDRLLAQRVYGKADHELGAPITADTLFRIASITKTFTAAAVVIARDAGLLKLEDPLATYVPGFVSADRITLRHLLLHQSGVGNPDEEPGLTLHQRVERLGSKPLLFEPGTGSRYSNGGYMVLARVVEVASKRPFHEFLAERVLRPAGALSTRPDDPLALVPGRARGYVPGPTPPGLFNALDQDMSHATGGGDLLSSVPDLHRWARAFRDNRLFDRTKLEHPYGWGARTYFGRAVVEQSGLSAGSSSYLAIYLDDDLYVVMLSNLANGLFNPIGKAVGAIALGEKPESVRRPASTTPPPADLSPYIGMWRSETVTRFLLEPRGADLTLRWDGDSPPRWLTPQGGDSFFCRADRMSLQFERDAGGAVSRLLVRWDGDPVVYTRERH